MDLYHLHLKLLFVWVAVLVSHNVALTTRVLQDVKLCQNIKNDPAFNRTKFMEGSWYETQRTENDFESDGCGKVTHILNNDTFLAKFGSKKIPGLVYKDTEMILIFQKSKQYKYVVVDTDDSTALLYACGGNPKKPIAEYVWLLTRNPGAQLNWMGLPALEKYPYLMELLTNNTACQTDPTTTTTTTPTTPNTTVSNAQGESTNASSTATSNGEISSTTLIPSTATSIGEITSTTLLPTTPSSTENSSTPPTAEESLPTTDPDSTTENENSTTEITPTDSEETTATENDNSTTQVPPTRGESTTTGNPHKDIIGFHIPNSNKTFYFVSQFK